MSPYWPLSVPLVGLIMFFAWFSLLSPQVRSAKIRHWTHSRFWMEGLVFVSFTWDIAVLLICVFSIDTHIFWSTTGYGVLFVAVKWIIVGLIGIFFKFLDRHEIWLED